MRAVVLGHSGGTFCAGADLAEAGGGDADPGDIAVDRARELTRLLRRILELPMPVIAAIDGHVRAGGLGLVGACDIVVAGQSSTFALTEARIGVAPSIISLTAAAEDDRACRGQVLPDRREVRRPGGRGDRPDHDRHRRRGRDGGGADRRDRQGVTAGIGGVEGVDDRADSGGLRPRRRGTDPSSPRACSSPRKPGKGCWRFCRSARRGGPRATLKA